MGKKRNGILRIRSGKVSIFRIRETKKSDAGEYEYRAQNKFGTASTILNICLTSSIG